MKTFAGILAVSHQMEDLLVLIRVIIMVEIRYVQPFHNLITLVK